MSADAPVARAGSRDPHAQSSNDPVMPADLMARTWSFLHIESGANHETYRTTSGHAMSPEVVSALGAWLTRRSDDDVATL